MVDEEPLKPVLPAGLGTSVDEGTKAATKEGPIRQ